MSTQSHQSLYLKYRPQDFTSLVGQKHVRETLRNAVRAEQISHAYLFCGPRGTGKTSTARILARAINCLGPVDGEPCGVCENCKLILSGRSMDIIELDAASNRRIDDIRDLREKIRVAPSQLPKKVYIIDEVHQLVSEAFNALLKTLEEPPDFAHLVLATTEPQKVPETIRSRCQRFDFRRVATEDLAERLRYVVGEEGMGYEEAALYAIARAADGGMRDGLSMLEQVAAYSRGQISLEAVGAVLGTVDTDFLLTLSEALGARQTERVMLLVRQAVEDGKDIAQLLGELIGHFRDLLLLKSGTSFEAMHLPTAYEHRFEAAVAGFSVAQLLALLELLAETEKDLRWSTQHALLLEVALVRALYLLQYGGAPTLVAAPATATSEAPRPRPQAQAASKPSEQEERSEAATTTEPEAEPALEAPADPRLATSQNLIEILRARLEKEGEVSLATMVCQLWVEEDSPAKLVLATDYAFCYERLKTGDKWDVLASQAKALLGAKKQIDFVLREKKSLNPEPVTAAASTEPSAALTVTSLVQDILARFPEAQIVDAPPEGEPDEPEQADAADGQADAAEDDPDAGGTG